MADRFSPAVIVTGTTVLIGVLAAPSLFGADAELVGFRISIGVDFETAERSIPGWEGGAIFEPVGYGIIDIRAGFPPDGGEAEFIASEVVLKRYEGVGPNCTLRIPDDALDREFAPIVFGRIHWNREQNTIHIAADVDYPEYEMVVGVTCPPVGEVAIPDRPLYKIFGPLVDPLGSEPQGLVVRLSEGPVSSRSVKDVRYGDPVVMTATLDIVVERNPADS